MYDIFIDLIIYKPIQLALKLLVIPGLSLLLVYITQGIWLKLSKAKKDYEVHTRLILLNSIQLVVVLLNVYWFFIIKYNGPYVFTWDSFDMALTNIYLMLSPIFLTYIILLVLFLNTQTKIKKSL